MFQHLIEGNGVQVLKCQYEGGYWLMKEYTPDSYLDAIDIVEELREDEYPS